jgi:hypothetical protein
VFVKGLEGPVYCSEDYLNPCQRQNIQTDMPMWPMFQISSVIEVQEDHPLQELHFAKT